MFFTHRKTHKKLKTLREARDMRVAKRRGRDILMIARNLARWGVGELRSGGREYWYPNRFAGIYRPAKRTSVAMVAISVAAA